MTEQEVAETAFALTEFQAILLGAGISLVSSLFVFWITLKKENRKADEALRSKRDRHARIGLAKLVRITNQLHSLDRALDREFAEAQSDGSIVLEPGLAVRAFISGVVAVERLSDEELEFLFFSNSGGLVTRIQLLDDRVSTNIAVRDRYSFESDRFEDLMATGEIRLDPDSGNHVHARLDERTGYIAEAQLGKLNRLLADLVEATPKLLAESKAVLDEYRTLAEKEFGGKFPKIEDAEV